jgi:uncharacterized iron-regulated protein
MRHSWFRWLGLLGLCVGVGAAGAAPARLLLFGEQHDQPDQQRQVAEQVQALAARGELAALVLEMAERPHGSSGLPRDASELQVRDALQWRGWPWERYAAVVMNAVRAGVPVLGGNLPREQMRAAMGDATLDALLDDATRALLADAVRVGHCHLLPPAQESGMVRIQIARDRSMAQVAAAALRSAPPGSTVLLLAGAQHASLDRGVPPHLRHEMAAKLPALQVVLFGPPGDGLSADERRPAVFTPQEDHCEGLRRRLAAPAAASASR